MQIDDNTGTYAYILSKWPTATYYIVTSNGSGDTNAIFMATNFSKNSAYLSLDVWRDDSNIYFKWFMTRNFLYTAAVTIDLHTVTFYKS